MHGRHRRRRLPDRTAPPRYAHAVHRSAVLCAASETRRRCRVSRSASSAVRVSREVSRLLPACFCHPFFEYSTTSTRSLVPTRSANPLDDGIGYTLVQGAADTVLYGGGYTN